MPDEEFERYKNFILEQQAQSVVTNARIEATLTRLAGELSLLTAKVGQLGNVIARLDRYEGRNGETQQ
jgi:hypothetical protein